MPSLPSSEALHAYRDAVCGVRDLSGLAPHVVELVHLGLAVREAPHDRILPVPPAEAMRLLMDRLADGLSDWNRRATQTIDEIERLGHNDLVFHHRRSGGVRILPDRVTIEETVPALLDAAGEDVLVLDAGLGALHDIAPLLAASGRRRVIRTRDGAIVDPGNRLTGCCEVRQLGTGPFSMVVVDREQALIPLDVTGECGGVLVRAPILVAALASHFELLWDRAVDVDQSRSQGVLAPATLRVLHLLAAGFNDEEVAVRLNVTSRTVGRHVQAIVAATNSRTRFEACAKAFRHGWLN